MLSLSLESPTGSGVRAYACAFPPRTFRPFWPQRVLLRTQSTCLRLYDNTIMIKLAIRPVRHQKKKQNERPGATVPIERRSKPSIDEGRRGGAKNNKLEQNRRRRGRTCFCPLRTVKSFLPRGSWILKAARHDKHRGMYPFTAVSRRHRHRIYAKKHFSRGARGQGYGVERRSKSPRSEEEEEAVPRWGSAAGCCLNEIENE